MWPAREEGRYGFCLVSGFAWLAVGRGCEADVDTESPGIILNKGNNIRCNIFLPF